MVGNYLLNIGPKSDGAVPQASIDLLKAIGERMRSNGEAIEGAGSSPFINQFEWGSITRKPGKLYLNIVDWPEESLSVYGLKNKINKAYLLETGIEISILREGDYLIINTPDEPVNPYVSVIVLEIEGEPEVKDGRVLLETELAAN